MKRSLFLPVFLCLILNVSAHSSGNYSHNGDVLLNAEQQVMAAFVQAKMKQSPDEIQALGKQFLDTYKAKKNKLAAYWYAYNCYYECIYHMGMEDNVAAKKTLKAGITMLSGLSDKNSEDYALLASMQSLSIPLYASYQAIFISAKVKKNGEKALAMDPSNLRALLVLGSSDYYTPTQYGGGKKVEDYLIKAIKLSAQKVENPYLPAWGKNTAYELLIRYYLREDRKEEAKAMFKAAKKVFPEDYQISSLAEQLID